MAASVITNAQLEALFPNELQRLIFLQAMGHNLVVEKGVEVISSVVTKDYGTLSFEKWDDGLVVLVSGSIVYKSWKV